MPVWEQQKLWWALDLTRAGPQTNREFYKVAADIVNPGELELTQDGARPLGEDQG